MINNFWLGFINLFPNILSLVIISGLFILTYRRKLEAKWIVHFLFVLASLMIWIVGNICVQITLDANLFNLGGKILFTGIIALPYSWLFFALSFSGHDEWITKKRIILISIIPVLSLIIMYSDSLSPLMRVVTSVQKNGPVINYTVQYGLWFWIHTASSYSMLLIGEILVLYSILTTSRLIAGQKILILISCIVPWIANSLYVLGITGNNDYTTVAFTLLALVTAINFLQFKFLDIGPIARGVVFENMEDPVIVLDVNDKIIDVNSPAVVLAQQDRSRVLGQIFPDVFSDFSFLMSKYRTCEEFKVDVGIPKELPVNFFNVQINIIKNVHQKILGRVIVLRNVNEQEMTRRSLIELNQELDARVLQRTIALQKELERNEIIQRSLKESDERYSLAIQGANDGIWDWNLDTGKVFYSPRWKSMIGYSGEEIPAVIESWLEKVHPDDRGSLQIELSRHIEKFTEFFEHTHRLICKDGSSLWVRCRGMAKRGEDGVAERISGSMTDISAQKKYEDQILFDAFHDQMTGLPNRAYIIDRVKHSIRRAKRTDGEYFALIFLDLDRFKNINDSLGHQTGDLLLQIASKRLVSCLRSIDTVSRFGGDEFVILLDSVTGIEEVENLLERIIKSLSETINLNENEVSISASLGVVIFSDQYECPDDILSDADIAMYQAKKNSYRRYEIFNPEMRKKAEARLNMEIEIRRALELNEFELFYQPIVNAKNLSLQSFEALLRWHSPEKGYILPDEFISYAEETGLINPIGEWVLREACKQISVWKNIVPPQKDIVVSINLSARQFTNPRLCTIIFDCLDEFQINGHNLILEITESTIIHEKEKINTILGRLRASGIQVYIDDFGTGYSSLSYLHALPFDAIKIDKSFINQINSHGEIGSIEIVQTIISLSKELRKRVIAEGVETQQQLDILNSMDCNCFQGYLVSKPMDKFETGEFLIKERHK